MAWGGMMAEVVEVEDEGGGEGQGGEVEEVEGVVVVARVAVVAGAEALVEAEERRRGRTTEWRKQGL